MSHSKDKTPDTWEGHEEWPIKHAGADIYYSIIADGVETGGKAANVWIWHWHMPSGDPALHRWQISGCGLHDVLQVEPLTLSPSLACEDGCPSHGYIENGVWRSV